MIIIDAFIILHAFYLPFLVPYAYGCKSQNTFLVANFEAEFKL